MAVRRDPPGGSEKGPPGIVVRPRLSRHNGVGTQIVVRVDPAILQFGSTQRRA